MSRLWTMDEIVDHITTREPRRAYLMQPGQAAEWCSTPIIEAVVMDGVRYDLKRVEGKIAVGYIRVSTDKQRAARPQRESVEGDEDEAEALDVDPDDYAAEAADDSQANLVGFAAQDPYGRDGFSDDDQARRLVRHFVAGGLAFRLVTDAGLSGGLPNNDAGLIEKLRNKKAERYKEAFEAVFFDTTTQWPPSERAALEQFLNDAEERIKTGERVEGAPVTALETNLAHTQAAEATPSRSARRPRQPTYRPGLTLVMEMLPKVHRLVATDWSRISRSYALTTQLVEAFQERRVRVEGTVERIDWINTKDFGAQFFGVFMSMMAEYKLREVSVGVLRGHRARLEAGLPLGPLPLWLDRDPANKRKIAVNAVGLETARIALRLYLGDDGIDRGWQKVCLGLTEAGRRTRRGGSWKNSTVRQMLLSPAMIGKQKQYGLMWEVYPVQATDEATYNRVLDRAEERAERLGYNTPVNTDGYLATGLIRCWCGRALVRHPHSSGYPQYKCPSEKSQRVRDSKPHLALNQADLDKFLNALMETHPVSILEHLKPTAEREQVLSDIELLRAEAAAVRAEMRRSRPGVEAAVRAQLATMGIDLQRPGSEALVGQNADAVQSKERERLADLEAKVTALQYDLKTQFSAAELSGLEERIRAWQGLTDGRRNALLREIFAEFVTLGDPPDEALQPKLRSAGDDDLPPIPLKTRVNGTKFIRRLPSVSEWYDSALAWADGPTT